MNARTVASSLLVPALLGGCSGAEADPYFAALEDAGWVNEEMSERERRQMYEDMAADVCAEMRELMLAGFDNEAVVYSLLRKIDGNDPMGDRAAGTLNALLDYRCDAGQASGLKAE
ncbi:hypothetical protein FA014_01885 [Cellulomonas hominis]|uniref:DUF732 domain-containing protein n=1 Tax=Cellulomonas hominis TaxID=156981 RepID=A0A7Z8K1W3_9CELL|nr:hypothetical protein [Cellulomonas hominis]TKR27132.1 hypothetical protein FA014_01885 [Cellulomonas hominis]